MSKWVHVLESVDETTGTGVCRNCGIVDVCWQPTLGRWRCKVAKKEHKGTYTKNVEQRKRAKDLERTRSKGITQERLEDMYLEQDYRCAWCGRLESELVKKLSIDHCHETGEVRRLLCFNCNLAEGNLKHSLEIIAAIEAVAYIKTRSRVE